MEQANSSVVLKSSEMQSLAFWTVSTGGAAAGVRAGAGAVISLHLATMLQQAVRALEWRSFFGLSGHFSCSIFVFSS